MGRTLVLSILCLLMLFSCDKNRVYDTYKSLPNEWDSDSIISFKVEDMDTIRDYHLFLNLRNTNDYAFSNIYLITEMNYPNGKVVQDTLEYEMAFPDGQWMGKGMGDSKTSKLWYKKNVRFSEEGPYVFEIRQVMRKNGEKEGIQKLKGITEVGLRIEKPN